MKTLQESQFKIQALECKVEEASMNLTTEQQKVEAANKRIEVAVSSLKRVQEENVRH